MSQTLFMAPHRHVLDVYADEAELGLHAAEYLRPGLALGYPTMIVATAALSLHVDSALRALGVDVDRPREDGTLLAWDANELLESVTVGGELDEDAFAREIGTVVRRYAADAPIARFGHMVTILWERGDVEGALRLEQLWNELGREIRLHIYCGFQAAALEHTDGLRRLAEVHDHVVLESTTESIELRPVADSARAARRFAAELLERWQRSDASGEVALVVSELVTNAVLHAGSDLTLSVGAQGDLVRVAVRDGSPELPVIRPTDHLEANGRGLDIVQTLSAHFGTFVAPDGKTVWAHLLVGGAS